MSHIGRQTNIFKLQVIENSKNGIETRHKRPSATLLPEELSPSTDNQRQPKRAKSDNSKNSLDIYGTHSSSISITKPIDNLPTDYSTSSNGVCHNIGFNTYQQLAYGNISTQFPNCYSTYGQSSSQMYSGNFMDNFNYGTVGANYYANSNFLFPYNQYASKFNTQQQVAYI